MPRSVNVSVDSPASVEQVLSAFGDEDYWRARLASFGGDTATLDSFSVDADGAATVDITVRLLGDQLHKMITQLHRGDLEMVRTERWSRTSGGRGRGKLMVAVPGLRLSGLGQALLAPVASGSRLEFSATVEVKIPLIGRQIENLIGGQLAASTTTIQNFTTDWIAENR